MAEGNVNLAYNARTYVSVFAYEETPSWDATASIEITNASSTDMRVAAIDGQFRIGGCTPANARGVTKQVSGLGSVEGVYLQPGYPYALPTQQFTTLAAFSSMTVQITLQGCALSMFSDQASVTTAGIDLAVLVGGELSRSAAQLSAAKVTFLAKPPGASGVVSVTPLPPTGAVYGTSQISISSCQPVPHAAEELMALNFFWGQGAQLCRISGLPHAAANRVTNTVVADQEFLDQMAAQYGQFAPTGILAHEWGHLVQGNAVQGVAAELQADCLAGVHLKWAGVNVMTLQQFERANFFNGDPPGYHGPNAHGSGTQRVAAARRGYEGFDRGRSYTRQEIIASICPSDAVY